MGFFSENCIPLTKAPTASDFLNSLAEEKEAFPSLTPNMTPQLDIESYVGQNKTQEIALQVFYRVRLKNTNEVTWQEHTKLSPSQTKDPPQQHRHLRHLSLSCPSSRPAVVWHSCTALAQAAGKTALWESTMWEALLGAPPLCLRAASHLSWSLCCQPEPRCPTLVLILTLILTLTTASTSSLGTCLPGAGQTGS